MLRDQQLVEQTVRQAVRANGHGSVEIARDKSRPCAIIGDSAGFIVNLERDLGRMRRHSDSSCLMMVAPDARMDMSAVDSLGGRFADNLRSYDSLCRYGANYFLVLLPHVLREDVPGIVRRLRVQVAGYPLALAGGDDAFVMATTGGAMLDADSTMHENIDRAVLACRAGMKRGGDTDQTWSPGLEAA